MSSATPGQPTATVHVVYGEDDVIVQIDDDGGGPRLLTPGVAGTGITGMTEAGHGARREGAGRPADCGW